MATTTSLGIGTGVDLQSMLSTLMKAESTPLVSLSTKIAATTSKISLYGTLKSKLDSLQSAADTLQFSSRMAAMTATSSDTTVLGASAKSTASAGSYAVEVTQLASAQKSFSTAYSAGTTFGQGTLNFTVGGTAAAAITLNDQSSYTLQEVGDRINNAQIGVTATVITASDGTQRMVLTGDKSGTGNNFSLTSTLTASGSQASLASFDTTTTGLKRSSAQDATMTVDGISVSSSSNVFSSTVAGLTLTATKLGTSTVTVQNDSTKITSAVKAFVDAYNDVVSTIKSNSAYDATTKTGQAFNGDSSIRSILSSLSNSKSTVPAALSSATFKTLADLGVSIQQTGLLSLDSTKLNNAISTSSSEVMKTLSAYGNSFSTAIDGMLTTGGTLTSRVDSLNASIKRDEDSQTKLQAKITLIEKNYRTQFNALDKLMSQMQTTSTALAQQLATLTTNN